MPERPAHRAASADPPLLNRREAIAQLLHTLARGATTSLAAHHLLCRAAAAAPPSEATALPITGQTCRELACLDAIVLDRMERFQITSATLAVSWRGRFYVRRGYGWMDGARTVPTSPDAIMRLASLDKAINETAIKLICDAKWRRQVYRLPRSGTEVSRALPVFRALQDEWGLAPPRGLAPDPWIYEVTLEHLMEGRSYIEPVDTLHGTMAELGLASLPTMWDVARCIYARRPRQRPGAGPQEYSNAAHGIIKLFIDKLSGNYRDFVAANVFAPAQAASDDVIIARARRAERSPREPEYHCRERGPSPFAEDQGAELPAADGGGWNFDACMQLATSAPAFCRYLDYWYANEARPLLDRRTRQLARWNDNGGCIGDGGMPGSVAHFNQRRWSLCNWVVLFNGVTLKDERLPYVSPVDDINRVLARYQA